MIAKIAKSIVESLEQQHQFDETINNSDNFVVAFIANKNGDAHVFVDWPKGLDHNYTSNIMAKMLAITTDGNIKGVLSNTIDKKASIENTKELGKSILEKWAMITDSSEEDDDSPVIDPLRVFKVGE